MSRKYLTIVCHKSTGWAIIKRGTLLLSISSPINDQFSKFFHWHTLWKICNNVIIIFIPPHRKCVYTTLRNMNEICMYNDNSKHLSKIEKKTLQTNIAVNDLYNTRSCGSNTVICVICMIHHNVGLKCFLFTLMFVIIIRFSYIYVSQGSVKTHLWCGGIYNNRTTGSCPQSVPVKKFLKSVNNWWRCGQK